MQKKIISYKKWSTNFDETYRPLIMAGGQIQLKSLLLGIEVGSRLEQNYELNYHTGLEFHQMNEKVIIRGGLSHNQLFCIGIGLDIDVIHIDYAYTYPFKASPFKPSHIISVGILLNKFNQIKGKITS